MYSKVLILIIIAFYCPLIQQSKAECILNLTQDNRLRPSILTNIKYDTSLFYGWDIIHMDNGEEIDGFCKMGFKSFPISDSQVTIYCDYDGPRVKSPRRDYYLETKNLECKPVLNLGTSNLCDIHLSKQKSSRPKVFKNIGTRNVQMSQEVDTIHLHEGQEATVRCESKFKIPMNSKAEINVTCLNGQTVAMGMPYNTIDSGSVKMFECESLQWNLYESATTLPWCFTSMSSYLLSRQTGHGQEVYEYLGGLCYDLKTMTMKSLYYTVGPKKFKNLSPKILSTSKPSIEISDINGNFISKKTFNYDNPQMEYWLEYINYKNASIVQNRLWSTNTLLDLEELLLIDWWNSLRLGNWRFYEAALSKHIELNSLQYDILAGTSGIVTVPIRRESCDKNITMIPLEDSDNNKMPLYIWNYLKSANSTGDDIVIIGVNSPFYDFYNETDLVFCTDMCHQVKWLANVYVTFRYKPMGVIFCCSADEVMTSQRLDGFAIPKESQPLPSIAHTSIEKFFTISMETTTTTTPEDTTLQVETFEEEREYDEYGNHY